MRDFIVKNIAILSLIFLTSCISNVQEHGIIIKAHDLDKLRVGHSRQFVVNRLLGPPSIIDERDGKTIWLYINYKKKKRPLRKPELDEYMIVELIFANSRLLDLQKYDLNSIKKVAFNPNVTVSKRKKYNIFREFLRNVGRFDGESDI